MWWLQACAVAACIAGACRSSTTEPPPDPARNPVPALTSVSPQGTSAGSPTLEVTLTGKDFLASSTLRWNGADRPTTFVNSETLSGVVWESDLAAGATNRVTIFSPPPGGGLSKAVEFAVVNPEPEITGLSPQAATAGGPTFALTVTGRGFLGTSVVRWGGQARPTTYVDARTLRVEITAQDIATFRDVWVSVLNPAPGGGTSPAWNLRVDPPKLSLKSNDLVYDPMRQRIYASVPGSVAQYGNSVVVIDPATAGIEVGIPVGSEPGELALSDDGQFLYVSLDSVPAVRRVHLATRTADLQFDVKAAGWSGGFWVQDLEVLPGAPHSVAISAKNTGSSPHMGVIIFDDGVPRDTVTDGTRPNSRIEFSAVPDTLYGLDNETTGFGFRTLAITAGGVREVAVDASLIQQFGADIAFEAGRIYATTGQVIEPASGTILRTLPDTGMVRPDAEHQRVFVLPRGSTEITAFSTTGFNLIGSVKVPGLSGARGSLIRWGADGLAFRTGTEIVLIRTDLVTR